MPCPGKSGAIDTVVVYDISDDKYRLRVAETCKDYGLEHIQYSAFEGDLSFNRREELVLRLRKTLGQHEGNIQIYVICEKDLALRTVIDVPAKVSDGVETSGAEKPQQTRQPVYRRTTAKRAGRPKRQWVQKYGRPGK